MAAAPPQDPARGRRRAYRGISGGVLLICIGSVLLLNTLRLVGWGVWFELLKLWPLLLISIGVRWIFVGSRAHIFCLIGPVLIALGTAWVVTGYVEAGESGLATLQNGEALEVDCPAPPAGRAAHLDLDFAAGTLRVVAEPPAKSTSGLKGSLRWTGREPRHSCGNSGSLRLRPHVFDDGVSFVVPFRERGSRWDARLSAPAPISIDARVAASSADLDLRAFDLQRLEIETAASRLRIELGPARARVPVRIHGAVADLQLVLPEGSCYSVSRDRILSVLDVDDDVHREDRARHLTSDACGAAPPDAPRYEIRYELPLSSVTIETEGRSV